jgi:hypothetical protein
MSNGNREHLVELVMSMNASEKRHFKILTNRVSTESPKLYVQLFDYIDKKGKLEEESLFRSFPHIKRRQLSNLKSALYKAILSSLRVQLKNQDADLSLRASLDHAHILHKRGLNQASLRLLSRLKKKVIQLQQYSILISILELEKRIESMYITGSMSPKAKLLTSDTRKTLDRLNINHELSNFSLSLYALYLQFIHISTEDERQFIDDYFKHNMPVVEESSLDFYGKLYLIQSYVWYNNMIQNFSQYFRYSQKWIRLFQEDPVWIDRELTLYMKGFHNVLNAAFMAGNLDKFNHAYEQSMELGRKRVNSMDKDQLSMFRLIEYVHGINRTFLDADYASGAQYVDSIRQGIDQNIYNWDLNRLLVFNYKMACIYFGNDQLDETIELLNRITNKVYADFRQDIQCFARILNLIAHFDLGNEFLVSYNVRSTYRFLFKMRHLQKALKEILDFLRRRPSISEKEIKSEVRILTNKLIEIAKDPIERRPFLYLDIISWLQGKEEGVSINTIIKRKLELKQKKSDI